MTTESKPQSRKDDEPDFSEPEPVARHRQEFETWAGSPEHSCYLKRLEFGDRAGQYSQGFIEFAWRAWLEAATRQDGYRQIVEWLRGQLAQGTAISATDPSAPLLQPLARQPFGAWVVKGGLTLQPVSTS